uniref:Uncharacterized protein n=1 Tax=Setaria digitata TaxID=48799 RepID=A0A915Q182_9BILA
MSNLKGVQVPFTKREWEIVTNLYRSDKIFELKHAVALIVSWKARLGDSVHVAADMTEMLLRAVIMDKETRNDDWFRIGNVKLAYCAAIIRFVNYVNEICQSKYEFKTIASAVSDVGIPEWVVDIRHNATHSHLPSLQSLRLAAAYCRNWLWEHHWSRPVAEAIGLNFNMQNENDENELQQEAANLINRFMLHSLKKKTDKTGTKKILQNIMTKMETFIMTHPWEFLNTFLIDGYLILDKKQVKSVGYDLFSKNENIWVIPEDLQLFWKPIFHYLNEAKMLPELLFQLFAIVSEDEVEAIRKRQVTSWIDRMLCAYVESNVLTQDEWERILKAIMLAPNEIKSAYFDKILQKVEKITEQKQIALKQLAILTAKKPTVSVESASPIASDISVSFKTVKDLKKLMEQKEMEKPSETMDSSNCSSEVQHWSACNPAEWKGIPLGLTPEQSTESLYLVIEPDIVRVRKRHHND